MRNSLKFIPGEELGAVAHWAFDDVDRQLLAQPEVDDSQPTQAERELEARITAQGEQMRQAGYADGFVQGRAAALLQAEKRHQDYVAGEGRKAAERLGSVLRSAGEQIEQSHQVMADGVLELACEIARQVLRHELSANPNALQPVVREGLKLLSDDSKSAVVRLHPIDLDVLRETLESEFSNLALTWVPDASIAQGGCLISSAGAVVDASVPTRWRRAVAKLGMEVQWDD